jgi:hypothetical protein
VSDVYAHLNIIFGFYHSIVFFAHCNFLFALNSTNASNTYNTLGDQHHYNHKIY